MSKVDMGGGSSKKKNPQKSKHENQQQRSTTQNRSNTDRSQLQGSSSSSSSSEDTPTPTISDRQVSIHRSRTPSGNNSPRSDHSGSSKKRISNGMRNTTISSNKDGQENNGNHVTIKSRSTIKKSERSSSSSSSSIVDRREIRSKSPAKHSTHREEKTTITFPGQTGRCSQCPHCQRQPVRRQIVTAQPTWVVQNPNTDHRHIIMDDFDEDAIREKVFTENGRLPGSYNYLPNLKIDERRDHNQKTIKYYTLPTIAKLGPPVSHTRTPFPNYDAMQRREQRLNKPYNLTLFTD